jgi:predicted dehydrogenase/threonine dehydrogenase-like Zn-dependent dehydrogenase
LKQVLQHVRAGQIEIAEVPPPQLLPGCVLVRIAASLVSAGTERAMSDFASKNLFQKARSRPDLVREVWVKAKRDGLLSTIGAIRNRLDQPTALGYSSAGTVIGVGDGITDLCVGDRVACAGAGYAVHAEIACVPRLLVARIPALPEIPRVEHDWSGQAEGGVPMVATCSMDEAAFTTVAAVALHGIRVAEVKLGDVVAVLGLGLLGQLTVQLLKCAGCRVVGMDILSERAELARELGADAAAFSTTEFRHLCAEYSGHLGVDAVLIAAETPSSIPVNLAAEIARDRGVVVAVGSVGLDIERKLYYDKELSFRVSRSYGPGRYDTAYEQKGRDYPVGYARWTETRNMEAVLQLLASGKLHLAPLITHRFPIDQALKAYDLITGKTSEAFLGVLITYPQRPSEQCVAPWLRERASTRTRSTSSEIRIGLLGAGNFATGTLLPALGKVPGIDLVGVCAATGVHSNQAAENFGFAYGTTSEHDVVNDGNISTIVISTRHHLHARQTIAALDAGKDVFCEKPLCLNESELFDIARSYASYPDRRIMVGFNRRFAPMVQQIKCFLDQTREPLAMHYRVNAGYLPRDHWVNDPEQGGGRIVGEVCHFIDLLSFLAGSLPVEVQAQALADSGQYSGDNLAISLRFANGSQGTISYLANGDRSFSKERLEVFGGGAVAVLDDFRRLELIRNGRRQVTHARWRQDKGHRAEWAAFAHSLLAGTASPIAFEQLVATTLTTLRIKDSIALGTSMPIDTAAFLNSCWESPSLME